MAKVTLEHSGAELDRAISQFRANYLPMTYTLPEQVLLSASLDPTEPVVHLHWAWPSTDYVDGIIIRMNPERNGRHHKPHIHARYQGVEASFDIASRKIFAGASKFPSDQKYMVQAWIVKHEAELGVASWRERHVLQD